jgi:hypothetical protein
MKYQEKIVFIEEHHKTITLIGFYKEQVIDH